MYTYYPEYDGEDLIVVYLVLLYTYLLEPLNPGDLVYLLLSFIIIFYYLFFRKYVVVWYLRAGRSGTCRSGIYNEAVICRSGMAQMNVSARGNWRRSGSSFC